MFSQNKIIFFCYAYLVGIALAMSAPVDPAGLPLLRMLTGLALAAAAWVLWMGVLAQRADQPDNVSPLVATHLVVPARRFAQPRLHPLYQRQQRARYQAG
jgi:hypothetical protein